MKCRPQLTSALKSSMLPSSRPGQGQDALPLHLLLQLPAQKYQCGYLRCHVTAGLHHSECSGEALCCKYGDSCVLSIVHGLLFKRNPG